jgi:hypothetical protein
VPCLAAAAAAAATTTAAAAAAVVVVVVFRFLPARLLKTDKNEPMLTVRKRKRVKTDAGKCVLQ